MFSFFASVVIGSGYEHRNDDDFKPYQHFCGKYLGKVYDILSKHRTLLSSGNPDNHLFMLDDFLGSGRISSWEAKPIELLFKFEPALDVIIIIVFWKLTVFP